MRVCAREGTKEGHILTTIAACGILIDWSCADVNNRISSLMSAFLVAQHGSQVASSHAWRLLLELGLPILLTRESVPLPVPTLSQT